MTKNVQKYGKFIGHGILFPFQRNQKNDILNGTGIKLIKSSIKQILGTTCSSPITYGELPYDQQFGSLLTVIRHKNIDDPVTYELAVYYVVDALKKCEPRIKIRGVKIVSKRKEFKFIIKLAYDIIDSNIESNKVIEKNVIQEVEV